MNFGRGSMHRRRIVRATSSLEPGQTRTATIHVPLNRRQRQAQAADMVKRYRDDLLLLGLDPKKCQRDLAKWDGVDQGKIPSWLKEKT